MAYSVRETDAATVADALFALWRRNLQGAGVDLEAKLLRHSICGSDPLLLHGVER